MLILLQALGAGTGPRTQLECQGWVGVAQSHQKSLAHAFPLLLLSITSFLLTVFPGACCSSHCFTATEDHCNTAGRLGIAIIFPLNTSKAPEKYLINLCTPLEKKKQTTKQNKTNNKLRGSSGK